MQVFYDNSPPEALAIPSSGSLNGLPAQAIASALNLRKQIVVLVLVALALITTALGIDLGIGLRHPRRDNATLTLTPSKYASILKYKITTERFYSSTATNATGPVHIPAHDIMYNTSLATVTRPSGNREVYFQENIGAFRRALYSFQANLWHTSKDQFWALNARNNTQLAALSFNSSLYQHSTGITLNFIQICY